MPKTITKTIYTYDELSDKSKARARAWYREGNDLSSLWDDIREDAKSIGLKIISLDQHRANKGEFIRSAPECAETILREHGDTCETYKTAKGYLDALQKLGDRPSDTMEDADDNEYEDAREDLDKEFLQSLLSDYFYRLQRDEEYAYSEESVSENILINEYTFDEDGNREG